jgi:hypothetical protein
MKFLRVALLAVVSTLAVSVQAQTADEIINKHIEAIGGKDKIAAMKSIYTEYDMDIMGNTASGVTYLLNGKGFRNEVDFGGQKIIQVYTDKGGWGVNPMQGQTAPEAMPEEVAKAGKGQMEIGGPLFNYVEKGSKVELVGKEDVNGVSAHKIKVTTKDGPEVTYLIDPTTFYAIKAISKATVNGQEVETVANFSNYKKSDYGYVSPGSTELVLPQGFSLTITSKKVEVNKEIDPKIFEMGN